MKLYVVLRFENEYDQFGGYFHGVYTSLSAAVSPNGYFGRKEGDQTWYSLTQISPNKEYNEESYPHDYKESLEVKETLVGELNE